jgi:hypothetical protein
MYFVEYNVATSLNCGAFYLDGASFGCPQVLCDIHVLWWKALTKSEG